MTEIKAILWTIQIRKSALFVLCVAGLPFCLNKKREGDKIANIDVCRPTETSMSQRHTGTARHSLRFDEEIPPQKSRVQNSIMKSDGGWKT